MVVSPYSVHLINKMKRFLIPNKLKSSDITENVSSVLDPSKIDYPCTYTTVVESIKPDSKQTNSNELFKLNVLDLSSTCDETAVQPVINFPLQLFPENIDVFKAVGIVNILGWNIQLR